MVIAGWDDAHRDVIAVLNSVIACASNETQRIEAIVRTPFNRFALPKPCAAACILETSEWRCRRRLPSARLMFLTSSAVFTRPSSWRCPTPPSTVVEIPQIGPDVATPPCGHGIALRISLSTGSIPRKERGQASSTPRCCRRVRRAADIDRPGC